MSKWLPRFRDSVISCLVSERKCGERLWEDSVLGGGGFGLVDLLLGLCLCFWVCGFWFSILRSLSLDWCAWYSCSRYF